MLKLALDLGGWGQSPDLADLCLDQFVPDCRVHKRVSAFVEAPGTLKIIDIIAPLVSAPVLMLRCPNFGKARYSLNGSSASRPIFVDDVSNRFAMRHETVDLMAAIMIAQHLAHEPLGGFKVVKRAGLIGKTLAADLDLLGGQAVAAGNPLIDMLRVLKFFDRHIVFSAL